ncbi:hypothetical protein SprV_0100275100 [Sparganum proliferum]
MSFLANFLKKFRPEEKHKSKELPSILIRNVDPTTVWENISELGDGAFGKVYKASHRQTAMLSALKSVEYSSDEELEDFLMYLEFCGGGAVDNIMKVLEKPLTESQIRFIAHEVICGLEFLHKNLIIHRDLKAGNILITLNYEIRLADFGVSARMASEAQKRTTFIGTPYWMAPEVIACETFKDNPYDMSADVWSFGITLIEFAEMLPPFNDMNPTRVLMKITKSDPPTFARPQNWSPALNNMLSKCLNKTPGLRPTMTQLKTDPFVADVKEADRSVIKLLLGELNADVEETVEEIAPEDLPTIDPTLVSPEVAQSLAESLQEDETPPLDEELVRPSELMETEETEGEDVEFEEIVMQPPSATGSSPCICVPDNASPRDKALLETANALVDEVLLQDIDFTSLPYIAFENLRERSDSLSRQETVFGPSNTQEKSRSATGPPPVPVRTVSLDSSAESEAAAWTDRKEVAPSPLSDLPLQRLPEKSSVTEEGTSICSTPQALKVPHASSLSRVPSQYRTSTRVRRFVVDGKEVTTTSKRVVMANSDGQPQKLQQSAFHKKALRDFRLLAKEDKWKNRELRNRAEQQSNQLEAKLSAEITQLHRQQTRELEAAAKKFKASSDMETSIYEADIKNLRDQTLNVEKEVRGRMKSKLDSSNISRSKRKAILRDLMDSNQDAYRPPSSKSVSSESAYSELSREVAEFRDNQRVRWDLETAKLKEAHDKKLAHLSIQHRSEQFMINQNHANEQWKMEQRHMQMRYQLAANQIRDFSMAQRQLLARRLASELADLKESAEAERSNFLDKQALEKKEFFKREKYNQKKQLAEFQKKLREENPDAGSIPREALAKFQEHLRQNANRNLINLEKRQRAQLRALDTKWMSRFTELDQQQAEKKNILVDQETKRLRELNEEHRRELKVHSDTFARKIAQLREDYERDIASQADFLGLREQTEILSFVPAEASATLSSSFCHQRNREHSDTLSSLSSSIINGGGSNRRSLLRPHRHHHHHSRSSSGGGASFLQSLSVAHRQSVNPAHSVDNLVIREEELADGVSDVQRFSSSSTSSVSASYPDGAGDIQQTSSTQGNEYCPAYRF